MANRAQPAHLLRRATFGPPAEEVDAAERAGPATVERPAPAHAMPHAMPVISG